MSLNRFATMLILSFVFAGISAAAANRPNILFILADDLGYGDVACYNPEAKAPTPYLDALARQDMRFTDAHSPSSRNVIDNLMQMKAKLDMPNQGQHVLNIWMVDPGVVIDKIIIDTGGVRDSYLGLPESVYHHVSE